MEWDRMGWDRMGSDRIELDGMGWDRMGSDWMGSDGIGLDEMGWDTSQITAHTHTQSLPQCTYTHKLHTSLHTTPRTLQAHTQKAHK